MAFRWERQHYDPGARMYDERGFYIGQVAQYTRCGLCEPSHEHQGEAFYRGFLRGVKVTEDFDTISEAQKELERVASGRSGTSPSR